jgi:hypothetical protein
VIITDTCLLALAYDFIDPIPISLLAATKMLLNSTNLWFKRLASNLFHRFRAPQRNASTLATDKSSRQACPTIQVESNSDELNCSLFWRGL